MNLFKTFNIPLNHVDFSYPLGRLFLLSINSLNLDLISQVILLLK